MRVIRRLAFLTLLVLFLPNFASAAERGRREILPRLEAAWIWEVLSRPWILVGKAPAPDLSKGGGMMDPNGNPCPDPTVPCEGSKDQ